MLWLILIFRQVFILERPYSNPVYLDDYFIMERPVTNKEMKEFFDSEFAKQRGLKPFYAEDAKGYFNCHIFIGPLNSLK